MWNGLDGDATRVEVAVRGRGGECRWVVRLPQAIASSHRRGPRHNAVSRGFVQVTSRMAGKGRASCRRHRCRSSIVAAACAKLSGSQLTAACTRVGRFGYAVGALQQSQSAGRMWVFRRGGVSLAITVRCDVCMSAGESRRSSCTGDGGCDGPSRWWPGEPGRADCRRRAAAAALCASGRGWPGRACPGFAAAAYGAWMFSCGGAGIMRFPSSPGGGLP